MISTLTGLKPSIELALWIGLFSWILAIIYTKLTMEKK